MLRAHQREQAKPSPTIQRRIGRANPARSRDETTRIPARCRRQANRDPAAPSTVPDGRSFSRCRSRVSGLETGRRRHPSDTSLFNPSCLMGQLPLARSSRSGSKTASGRGSKRSVRGRLRFAEIVQQRPNLPRSAAFAGKEHLDNALSGRLPSHAAVNYPLVLIRFFVNRRRAGEPRMTPRVPRSAGDRALQVRR